MVKFKMPRRLSSRNQSLDVDGAASIPGGGRMSAPDSSPVENGDSNNGYDADCRINAEQRVLIDQLRVDLRSWLTVDYDTDFNLLRWLKAYQFNVDEVRRRLQQHLRMRQLLELDHIESMDFSDNEVYTKYVPIGFLGPSGIGDRHVMFELAGRADPDGLMKSLQPTVFMMSRLQLLLRAHRAMSASEAMTNRQSGLIYIYDMDELQMDPLLLPIVVGPMRILWQHISDNCPEMIHKLIVINTPAYMNVLYRALAPFLPEHTKKKVVITGSDWRDVLLQYVARDRLPVHWGGTLVDSKGDPMCREYICVPPGKIPKHLYWTPPPGHPTMADLSMVTVGAGGKTYISFITNTADTILHWYLQCDAEFTIAAYYIEGETMDADVQRIEAGDLLIPSMEQPGTPVIDHMRWPLVRVGTYHFKLGNEKAWIKSVYVNHKMIFETRQQKSLNDVIMLS